MQQVDQPRSPIKGCTVTKTHAVVNRSPFGVDDHEFTSIWSSLLAFSNSLLAELFDSLNLVDVCAVCTGTEDGTNQGRSVLVGSRKQGADSLFRESPLQAISKQGV